MIYNSYLGNYCYRTLTMCVCDRSVDLFTTVRLTSTSTPNAINCEPKCIIKELPSTCPFDISVLFDPLIESEWPVCLLKPGFDVTIVSSKPVYSTSTRAAKKLRLRKGEKDMFQCRRKIDHKTGITMTGDQIIGNILDQNMALLPILLLQWAPITALVTFSDASFSTVRIQCPYLTFVRHVAPEKRRQHV